MTNIKAIRKYLKVYTDDTLSPRDRFPLSRETYLAGLTDSYTHTAQEQKSESIAIRIAGRIRSTLYRNTPPYYWQLYHHLPSEDWEAVNDAQYQYGRYLLTAKCVFGLYYDPRPVLEVLAANDWSILDCNAPDALGEHSWGPWQASGNLLLGLYHRHEPTIEKGVAQSEKLLALKKTTQWDKAYVGYFLALAQREMVKASRYLNEVCAGYSRLDLPPVAKTFCSLAHGMYNFARRILSPEEFAQLEMPVHDSFIREFATWQQEQGYPCGKIAFLYPEPQFRILNQVLQLQATALRNVPDEMRKRLAGMTRTEKYGNGYSTGCLGNVWPEKQAWIGQAWIDRFGQGLSQEILEDK